MTTASSGISEPTFAIFSAYQPFFEECDLVKFAKHIPPQKKMDQALDAARQLVYSTMEKPSVIPAPAIETAASIKTEAS